MNMSYCRFHNTNIDLRDCVGALEDLMENDGTISEDEFIAMHNLLNNCIRFAEIFGEVDVDYDEFDNSMDVIREHVE